MPDNIDSTLIPESLCKCEPYMLNDKLEHEDDCPITISAEIENNENEYPYNLLYWSNGEVVQYSELRSWLHRNRGLVESILAEGDA